MTRRPNWLIIIIYHVELLLVYLAGIVSAAVMFSIIRSDSSYRDLAPNFFCVVTGLLIYGVSYYFIWKGLLGKCWGGLKENSAKAGWYVWMAFITLGAGFVFLLLYTFAVFSVADYSSLMFPLFLVLVGYSVLLPVIRRFTAKKNEIKEG